MGEKGCSLSVCILGHPRKDQHELGFEAPLGHPANIHSQLSPSFHSGGRDVGPGIWQKGPGVRAIAPEAGGVPIASLGALQRPYRSDLAVVPLRAVVAIALVGHALAFGFSGDL